MIATCPLGDLLLRIAQENWQHEVLLAGSAPWSPEAPASVFAVDPYSDELPAAGTSMGMRPVLSVQDAQQVVANALAQKATATREDLVAAFNYYAEHDAFLDLVALSQSRR